MAVKSFQDFRQISQSFSYSELRNSPRNGTKVYYLYENKEMWQKSILGEALNPEMTAQSVSCFSPRGFASVRKRNLTILVRPNSKTKNCYQIFLLLLYLSIHCEILAGKKINKKCLSYTRRHQFCLDLLITRHYFTDCVTFDKCIFQWVGVGWVGRVGS